jgi:flagellar hook-associated protein 1 FlgK
LSDLLSQLSQASRSLLAHRASTATASHNIENASTPGYTRQTANLEASLPPALVKGGFIGTGVEVQTITQARDRFLDAQMPAALDGASFFGAEARTLTSVTTLDPDDALGIPTSLGNFYAAMRELSRAPSDAGARRAAVTASEGLASSVRRSASEIESLRNAADERLAAEATRANTLAAQVARLNAQVRQARAAGGPPNDLLDARRQAGEELASLTGARLTDEGGDLQVSVRGRAVVAGDRAASFSTQPDTNNRGHAALLLSGVDGAPPRALPAAEVGGTLGGIIEGRDGGLAAAESRLDSIAFHLAAQMNAVHSSGFALDGSTGRDLFTVGAQTGAALRISVTESISADPSLLAASSTGATGDNGAVLSMLGTESAALPSGRSGIADVTSMIDDFGAIASRAVTEQSAHELGRDQLQQMRDSTSGVSIDEELVEMTKAQRVFDAVTKVISTADDMLKGLLSLR